jgi:excisionase family DNA binding protein
VTPQSRNEPPGDVLTLAEAAEYLRLPKAELIQLVHAQGLPGRNAGSEWRFHRSAIQEWLSVAAATPQSRKEAQLALAGKYKEDRELMQICEEAYRQRGRMTEGE